MFLFQFVASHDFRMNFMVVRNRANGYKDALSIRGTIYDALGR